MIRVIENPTVIEAKGNMKKLIKEFVGNVNTSSSEVSIAKMESPAGWREPGQRPEFTEYTIVLKGTLQVETRDGVYSVKAGQGIIVEKGEWVKYSSPHDGGAEYIAVCLPAFSPKTVNRDED